MGSCLPVSTSLFPETLQRPRIDRPRAPACRSCPLCARRAPPRTTRASPENTGGASALAARLVAGLALTFTPEMLVGRRVVVVANLAPREFGSVTNASGTKEKLVSHGTHLATGPSEALNLAGIDESVPHGSRLK